MTGEILTGLDSIVDKFAPDADTKLKMQNEVLRLAMASADRQADINKVEAGHKSIYVAGGVRLLDGFAALRWQRCLS